MNGKAEPDRKGRIPGWGLGVLFSLALALETHAQVFVVTTDDARFMDGTTVVADIPREQELFALEVQDDWLLAVEPKSQTRYWISRSKTKPKTHSKDQIAEEARLWEQVTEIERIVNSGTATTQQLQDALACADGLRRLWNDRHPHAAIALDYAGIVAANAGAYAQAKTILDDALSVHQKLYGKNAPETAEVLLDLANLSIERRELKEAIQYARQAWDINREAFGSDHPDAIDTTIPVASAMEMIQEHEDALNIYQTAFRVYVKSYGPTHLQTLKTNAKIAQQLVALGRADEAIPIYESAVSGLEEHHPAQSKTIALQRLRLTSAKLNVKDPVSMEAFGLAIAELEKRFPDLAPFIRGEQRKLLANHLQTGQTADAFGMVDSRLRQLRQTLRKELWGMNAQEQREYLAQTDRYTFYSSISLAIDFATLPDVLAMSAEWLINGKGLVEEAQSVQGGASLDLAKREAWAAQPWIDLNDIRDAIPDNGVYVDILSYLDFEFDETATPSATEQRYAAWIVTKTGDVRFIDLGPADAIDQAVVDVRRAMDASVQHIPELGDQAAYEKLKPALIAASRLIWHPIREACGNNTELILSPDQNLWLLPWSALLSPDGQTFVAETHVVQLQLSGRELVRQGSIVSANPAVIFADPIFDAAVASSNSESSRSGNEAETSPTELIRLPSVERLTFSATEAGLISPAISRLTGRDPETWLQESARESTFKQLASPSVLVVSTHGFTLDEALASRLEISLGEDRNPLVSCGLMMAGANGHRSITSLSDDGVLTGLEIARTDLSGTRLAVLSACQTGLGELEATGGVVGLRRAFHLAGARSVVSSLWEIPDRDTMVLMQGFFEALADSHEIAASLQKAQQRHIEARRKRFGVAHPLFWAAFVMTGQSRFDVNSPNGNP
ncbi:CHAT domain-containing protein [Neorhodopirellula pilleata]|uniref:CHAT domain protein n=1 Tax=Neorhodopirellula pilleata TaxID=2714738 RepID=A0A5C6AQ38_9BACT|nr:CHAT domain-containing protein [Neorhodopirellula pilleata]TWU01830.1 CHAT domain protein [Neorhodopirellula pilleata]